MDYKKESGSTLLIVIIMVAVAGVSLAIMNARLTNQVDLTIKRFDSDQAKRIASFYKKVLRNQGYMSSTFKQYPAIKEQAGRKFNFVESSWEEMQVLSTSGKIIVPAAGVSLDKSLRAGVMQKRSWHVKVFWKNIADARRTMLKLLVFKYKGNSIPTKPLLSYEFSASPCMTMAKKGELRDHINTYGTFPDVHMAATIMCPADYNVFDAYSMPTPGQSETVIGINPGSNAGSCNSTIPGTWPAGFFDMARLPNAGTNMALSVYPQNMFEKGLVPYDTSTYECFVFCCERE